VLARHADTLPPLTLFNVTAIARDWDDAQEKFFADNAVIDTVYRPKPR
jgi:sulfate/thiosulfate transport system substrate-binding protein